MQKPPRPIPTQDEVEEDYDDGDPYSCIAAGAAGIEPKRPNYAYLVDQAYENRDPEQLETLIKQDLASVKTALYDLWTSGHNHQTMSARGCWAAHQMAKLGDSSLLEYDQAVPPKLG